MRTILLALLLTVQVAFGQNKPEINPCQDNDIEWGSSIKKLTDYAREHDMIFFDMKTDSKNGIIYMTYKTEDAAKIYGFVNGKYVNFTFIKMEVNKVKLENMIKEQTELYVADSDGIAEDGDFKYYCKGQELNVSLTKSTNGYLIIVNNQTAIGDAVMGDKKS